jgi:alpha-1,3-mannosyltransferase
MPDSDLLNTLAECGVFVFPSEHEGFGLSVVEALAAGLRVLCRDMQPLNSFFKDGREGLFLTFESPEKDAEKVAGLLAENAELSSTAAEGCRAASVPHDWESVMPKFIAAYRRALTVGA